MDGVVGVEGCAPKAGALPGCATPRQELLNHSKAPGSALLLAACTNKVNARIRVRGRHNCCSVRIFKQDSRTSSLLAACGRRDLAQLSARVLRGTCRAPRW